MNYYKLAILLSFFILLINANATDKEWGGFDWLTCSQDITGTHQLIIELRQEPTLTFSAASGDIEKNCTIHDVNISEGLKSALNEAINGETVKYELLEQNTLDADIINIDIKSIQFERNPNKNAKKESIISKVVLNGSPEITLTNCILEKSTQRPAKKKKPVLINNQPWKVYI